MSVSQLARAGRIDSEASRLKTQAERLNSQLASVINEALAFAAFMHTDPEAEFTQDDRDKYSADFSAALSEVETTLTGLDPLSGIEDGSVTVGDFLSSYNGEPAASYSTRFDKG